VKRLWQEEEGWNLVEYGLLLVLVSLGAVVAMGTCHQQRFRKRVE
jgi:Flp pilus assembly pilin Flp